MMFSRKMALAAAVASAITTAPVAAQTPPPPPPESRAAIDQGSGSDLWLILAAIVAAGLLTFLATQLGGNDDPASP